MQVSDYVAKFLVGLGIRHVFVVTGGANARLIDSVPPAMKMSPALA